MQQGTWNRNREHQGVQVSFPSKPELEVIHDLKNAGFKWSGRQKIWYAKEYPYRVELLNILATYGGEVGEEKSFAEIMEAKVERSKDRAERHRVYADNAAKKAEGCMNSAHQILDIIPLGQPILIGHHSEGRHRRDLARAGRYFEKAREEDKAAAYHKQRAGASASFERRTFKMATALRRIQRLEADFRRYHRELDQQELRKKYDRSEKISRKSLEYCEKQMDAVQEQLDYWKKVVAEHEDEGLKVWGPDDFKAGERILAHGRPAVIVKVNPKTLRVKFDLEWMNALDITKVPYDALSQECKEVA
jgi:hypothetical protein